MIDFASRIEKNIRKNSKSGKDIFEEYLFFISEGTNNNVSSLLNLPTPLVISIADNLMKLNKRKDNANKKR